MVPRDASEFPARLAAVPDAPERLYAVGRLPDAPAVAVVGARAATGRAMATAYELARDLAAAGYAIVSGGAVGVDAAAHRGAVDAGGATVAVQACGLDVAYPARHRPLFADIVAAGGALVSPYRAGVPPRRYQFVRRNRIVAGWAAAVVVVEADRASGSLYTARAARDYGRPLAAVPGSPGCDALVAEGAAVVAGAADVEAAIAGRPRKPDVALPEPGSEEAAVLAALDRGQARDAGALAQRCGLPARTVARALMGLELAGLAVAVPGRAYVRSAVAVAALAGTAGHGAPAA